MEKYFVVKGHKTVEIISCFDDVKQSGRLIKNIIESVNVSISFIFSVKCNNPPVSRWNNSAILLFDCFSSFNNFHERNIRFNNFTSGQKFLIYFPGLIDNEILRAETRMIDSFAFIIDRKAVVELKALIFYSPGRCNKKFLTVINKFSKPTGKWQSSQFFLKLENFFGCQLSFLEFDRPFSAFVTYSRIHGKLIVQGYAIDFINAIARHLNFTPYHNMFNDVTKKAANANIRSDMSLRVGSMSNSNVQLRLTIVDFMSDTSSFLIPPGEEFTPFEKMFLPFDHATWVAISSTMLIAVIAIQCLNYASINIQNLVYGDNVKTPTLNVLIAIVGGGQTVIPKKSFARFLLMMFIIFSLIIR